MTASDLCEVVITAPDPEWAAAFTRKLVEARLAACGHQFPIRSIYRWDGAIHDNSETRIALHTQRHHVDHIRQITDEAHPYEVPGFLVQSVSASPDYEQWVIESTTRPTGEPDR